MSDLLDSLLTVVWIVIECLIFLYYANSTLQCKQSELKSNMIVVAGYVIYYLLCILGNQIINITGFTIVNIVVLYLGFKDNIGSIILKAIILTACMMSSELIVSLSVGLTIINDLSGIWTIYEGVLILLFSKSLYFIMTVILKRMTTTNRKEYRSYEILYFLILPISTCLYFWLFNKLSLNMKAEEGVMFIIVGTLLVISNFIVYIVCDKIIDKNIKIQQLQSIKYKNDIDYKSYQLLREKYDELRIMVHDFNKYCNNIEAVLDGEKSESLSLIKKLKIKNKEFLLVGYTNNRALNILLSEKIKRCAEYNIDFQINIQNVDLSFIEELDTVSIFANLIDNAIESCINSKERKIFLSIYTMNDVYIVIRIDNSSKEKPVVINHRLQTSKKNKELHGVGMMSIEKSLKHYDGNIKWSYDVDTNVFTTMIIIEYQSAKDNLQQKL